MVGKKTLLIVLLSVSSMLCGSYSGNKKSKHRKNRPLQSLKSTKQSPRSLVWRAKIEEKSQQEKTDGVRPFKIILEESMGIRRDLEGLLAGCCCSNQVMKNSFRVMEHGLASQMQRSKKLSGTADLFEPSEQPFVSCAKIEEKSQQKEDGEVRPFEVILEESIRIRRELEELLADCYCSNRVMKDGFKEMEHVLASQMQRSKRLSVTADLVEPSDSDSSPSFRAAVAASFDDDEL